MFTLPILVIKLMTFTALLVVFGLVALEVVTRVLATKWEEVAEKSLVHLKVVKKDK